MYEDKIAMLKTQITQMEATLVNLQQIINGLNQQKDRYESQIVEMKNQISILKSEIERVNGIMREKESFRQSL